MTTASPAPLQRFDVGELEVAGALVRLQSDVNEANLRSVLRALRQRP